MAEVEIEYCVSCGYLKDAMRITEEILADHAPRLSALRFKMTGSAVFRVRVDGELVWDGRADPWEPGTVTERVRERLRPVP